MDRLVSSETAFLYGLLLETLSFHSFETRPFLIYIINISLLSIYDYTIMIIRDLSALLMCLCNNTVFDLLRNSYIIPYRFNADGHQNPIIMTDEHGNPLPEYKHISHDKNYIHFHEIYNDMPDKKDIYYAQAYRYSHTYDSEHMTPTQQVIVKHDGILLIRELPDTVKLKETEAEAYSAVWDLMIQIEKELPMAYVFYGQDSLVENDKRYDEIGIFLRSSHFLKNLEKHVQKAEAIIYGR